MLSQTSSTAICQKQSIWGLTHHYPTHIRWSQHVVNPMISMLPNDERHASIFDYQDLIPLDLVQAPSAAQVDLL